IFFFSFPAAPLSFIGPLSLHDALPISAVLCADSWERCLTRKQLVHVNSSSWGGRTTTSSSTSDRSAPGRSKLVGLSESSSPTERSEEHTSELQSRENLVCRLLLEKKKR